MSDNKVTYNTVESLPVLKEVPEHATLLAVVDGEFYHVPSGIVGGGSSYDAIIDVTGTFEEVASNRASANPHFGAGSYEAIIEKLNNGESASVYLRGTYMYGDVESKWEIHCNDIDYVPGIWLNLAFISFNGPFVIQFDGEGNLYLPADEPV